MSGTTSSVRRETLHPRVSFRIELWQGPIGAPPELTLCDSYPRAVKNFADFWTALKSSEATQAQEETDVVKWTFKDGTELEVKQEEHSVS